MEIILFNSIWMIYNIFLAFIAPLFGWFAYKTNQKLLKTLFVIVWFLFIPNTLYIVTDLIYFPKQISQLENIEKSLLILQYLLLELSAFIAFILSVYVFEKMLYKLKHNKKQIIGLVAVLNFLIGFGIILGRVYRANSWDVVTNTWKVIDDSLRVVLSMELLIMAFLFGIFANLIYFSFKGRLIKLFTELF